LQTFRRIVQNEPRWGKIAELNECVRSFKAQRKTAFYNHAYFTYIISMVANKKAGAIDKVRGILKDQNGILLTSDLEKLGIPITYLSVLVKNGEIQRVSRGVYTRKIAF